MAKRDARIDAYIESSAEFARPILERIREVVHSACPNVEETIRWKYPHFDYKGILCSMAAFKAHCALTLWEGERILGDEVDRSAMGHFGRLERLRDLPSKRLLTAYVRKAMALKDEGAKPSRKARDGRVVVPEDLRSALERNPKAGTTFEALSPSHRREYVDWIDEAKRQETRARRIAHAVEWLSEGKTRNWRYR